MRKITALLIAFVLTFSFAGCSSNQEEQKPAESPSNRAEPAPSESPSGSETSAPADDSSQGQSAGDESNILVAYFSWADNAVIEGDVDAVTSPSVTAPGNVQQLAGWVQEKTGGDLFSIQVTEPYPSGWDECLERANQERAEDARPELTAAVENMNDYDTVFLGYPNWWYGAPMALLSFLEENDLSNKQIYLFCSHGTGGLAGSVEDIQAVLPDSAVLSDNVFDVYEEEAASSQNAILDWLAELGY